MAQQEYIVHLFLYHFYHFQIVQSSLVSNVSLFAIYAFRSKHRTYENEWSNLCRFVLFKTLTTATARCVNMELRVLFPISLFWFAPNRNVNFFSHLARFLLPFHLLCSVLKYASRVFVVASHRCVLVLSCSFQNLIIIIVVDASEFYIAH